MHLKRWLFKAWRETRKEEPDPCNLSLPLTPSCWRSVTCVRPSLACRRSMASISTCGPARFTRLSVRTAQANPRSSKSCQERVLPDQGVVEILGQPHRRLTPHQAQDLGIRTIYQERSLVPWMSVSENILLGNLPGWGFLVDRGALYREAISTMERLDLHLDPNAEVASLGLGQQQGVEIAKALYHQARVLIMDEPTAALTGPEVDNLFRATRALRKQGLGIIYISHHLEEVFAAGRPGDGASRQRAGGGNSPDCGYFDSRADEHDGWPGICRASSSRRRGRLARSRWTSRD